MPSWDEPTRPGRNRGHPRPEGGGGPPGGSCFGCRHLTITHRRDWPFACGFFGMRTRQIPSREVLKSSGQPCHSYQPKAQRT